MKKHSVDFNVFVSFAYEAQYGVYKREDFESTLTQLFKKITTTVLENQNIRLNPIYKITEYGESIPSKILESIRDADLAIVDISVNNPNVLYELGCVTSTEITKLIIKKDLKKDKKTGEQLFAIPSDIDRENILYYSDIQHLMTQPDKYYDFYQAVQDKILSVIKNERFYFNKYYSKIWFPKDTHRIIIIVPPDTSLDEKGDDHIELDKYGDRDALMLLWGLMHRYYPMTKFEIYSSEDNINHDYKENMIVIGGPGSKSIRNNEWAKQIMNHRRNKNILSVRYSEDCRNMLYKNERYAPKRHDNSYSLEYDWGCFARIKNPYQTNKQIILIHGIHTYGVYGAAQIFSDHPNAQENIKCLVEQLDLKGELCYETYFPVYLENNEAQCPEIDETKLFS